MDKETAINAMRYTLYGFALAAGAMLAYRILAPKASTTQRSAPEKETKEPNSAMSSFVGLQSHGRELVNHPANDLFQTKRIDWTTGRSY